MTGRTSQVEIACFMCTLAFICCFILLLFDKSILLLLKSNMHNTKQHKDALESRDLWFGGIMMQLLVHLTYIQEVVGWFRDCGTHRQ